MNTNALISVVTVNYKQTKVTNQLLSSLQKVGWDNLEIIVVDNAFDPFSQDKLECDFDNVNIIRSRKNLGFAGGNNLGIRKAKGEYILFLNNDTEVPSNFIAPMVELFKSNPKIGAVSPLIKYWDKPYLIQYAGFTRLNPITQRIKAKAHQKHDIGQFTEPAKTYAAHGCAMMIPKKVIDEVGPMSEDYFLYYEEHDWSKRIKDAGYDIYFQPKSLVLHKESISTGKASTLKTYFISRNRILYLKLHGKGFCRLLSYTYLYLISIPYNLLRYSVAGQYEHMKAYMDAITWTLTNKTKKQWEF